MTRYDEDGASAVRSPRHRRGFLFGAGALAAPAGRPAALAAGS